MIINGVDRKFFMGVGAAMEIAEVCAGKDISKFGEFFGGAATSDTLNAVAVAAVAMNKAHIAVSGSKAEPLQRREVLMLTVGEWTTLAKEIAEAYVNGMKTTIEVEEPKGKNAPSEARA